MGFKPDQTFPSFRECVEFLYDQAKLDPWIKEGVQPRYLYRGENGCYETTLCGEDRSDAYLIKDDSGRRLASDDRARLHHLMDVLLWQLQHNDAYKLDAHEALGYIQHYELPTRLIDFSIELPCALAFAGGGDKSVGRIAAMEWPKPSDQVSVHQFSRHPWANRARRQKAVGVSTNKELADFKSEITRSQLGVKWYQFPIADDEREHFQSKRAGLVDWRDDEAAGFLRFHITEYVEINGKLSPALTDWLLVKIPIAAYAFLVKKVDLSNVVVNFRATERLPDFRKDAEQCCSLRYWSTDHHDCSWSRMKNWTWPDIGVIAVDPRTYHPDLYE